MTKYSYTIRRENARDVELEPYHQYDKRNQLMSYFFGYIISALGNIAFVLLNWNIFVKYTLFEDIFLSKA